MSNRVDFEKHIESDPYDLVTRKVFADWLEEHGFDDEAITQRSWTKEKQDAIEWMKDFAKDVNLTFEDCISAAEQYMKTGDYFDTGPNMDPENYFDEDMFWSAYELISGKSAEYKHNIFACSC